MPKQAHLPPRCPSQIRVPSTQPISPLSSPVTRNAGPDPSHLPLLEEEPSWFDDLLGGLDLDSPKGIFHRRSASDSSALLSISSSLTKPTSLFEVGNVSDETCKMGTIEESSPGTEACSGLEKGCVYGPNSPRKMSGLTDSESSMVSALLENATQNPLRCLSEDLSYVFESGEFDAAVDAFNAEVNPDPKPKTVKRHYGQRSRVRKLQYIAELERTVNVLQTLGSELAARVASLMQERVLLSIENSNLKQQLSSLQTEKMIKEGQHLFLKNEKERLKKLSMNHLGNKRRPYYQMGPTEAELSVNSWQALDMNKLSLGGRSVPLKHGFGRT